MRTATILLIALCLSTAVLGKRSKQQGDDNKPSEEHSLARYLRDCVKEKITSNDADHQNLFKQAKSQCGSPSRENQDPDTQSAWLDNYGDCVSKLNVPSNVLSEYSQVIQCVEDQVTSFEESESSDYELDGLFSYSQKKLHRNV